MNGAKSGHQVFGLAALGLPDRGTLSSMRLIVAKLLEKSQPVYLTGFTFSLTSYEANNPREAGCCLVFGAGQKPLFDNLSLAQSRKPVN
jgi:hypothetical protein